MPAREIEFSSSEIARWSEPLIADFIYSAYEHCFGGRTPASEALGSRHCRLWRNLLNEEQTVAVYLRRELLKAAAAERLPISTVDAIDAAVLDSLLDVLMRPGSALARFGPQRRLVARPRRFDARRNPQGRVTGG